METYGNTPTTITINGVKFDDVTTDFVKRMNDDAAADDDDEQRVTATSRADTRAYYLIGKTRYGFLAESSELACTQLLACAKAIQKSTLVIRAMKHCSEPLYTITTWM